MKLLKLKLFVIIVFTAVSCKPKCDKPIDIFEGASFKKGQKYVLVIAEGEWEQSQSFLVSMSRGKYKKIGSYCCVKDSVKVKFTLGESDTIFHISHEKTKKLLIGSYFDGSILIATDENSEAWIKM